MKVPEAPGANVRAPEATEIRATRARRAGQDADMPKPSGFQYEQHGDQSVTITHHGRAGTHPSRGSRAEKFLAEVVSGDAQLVMARWTGAYKHGNERTARDHPRNRR